MSRSMSNVGIKTTTKKTDLSLTQDSYYGLETRYFAALNNLSIDPVALNNCAIAQCIL